MKKLFIVFAILISGTMFSQENLLSFNASKTYEDGRTIAYCTSPIIKSEQHGNIILKQLLENKYITRAVLSDKNNYQKLMLEFTGDITKQEILKLFQKIEENENKEYKPLNTKVKFIE